MSNHEQRWRDYLEAMRADPGGKTHHGFTEAVLGSEPKRPMRVSGPLGRVLEQLARGEGVDLGDER